MLDTWKGKGYVSRAWCLFELFTAIQNHDVAIDIVLPPDQRAEFLQAIKSGGYGAIDDVLLSIKSEEAQATVEADLHAIKAMVEELPGQYATLDRTVRTHLQAWFEEQGVVKSASRVANNRTTSSKVTSSGMVWSKTTDTIHEAETEPPTPTATAPPVSITEAAPPPPPAAASEPAPRPPAVHLTRPEEDIIIMDRSDRDTEENVSESSRGGANGEHPALPPRGDGRFRSIHKSPADHVAVYEDELSAPNDWWGEVSHELQLALQQSSQLGQEDAGQWGDAADEFVLTGRGGTCPC